MIIYEVIKLSRNDGTLLMRARIRALDRETQQRLLQNTQLVGIKYYEQRYTVLTGIRGRERQYWPLGSGRQMMVIHPL